MKKGFTLIELLVAVSIIAVLSTVGLNTFSNVQKSARDSVRKGDLVTLATALEIYFQTNGKYLVNTGSCIDNTAGDILYTDTNFKKFISGNLPQDPKTKNHYCYESPAGLTYKLYAKLEDNTDYILTSEDYIAQATPAPTSTSSPTSTPTPTPTPAPTATPTPTPTPTPIPIPKICYDINRIDDFPPTYPGESIRLKPVVDWTKAVKVVMQYYEYPRLLAPPENPFIANKWISIPGGTITSSTGEVSWVTPSYPGDWWVGMVAYDATGKKIASWDTGDSTDCTKIVRLRPYNRTCGDTNDDGEKVSTEPVLPTEWKVYTVGNNVLLKWNITNSDGPVNDQFEAQRSLQAGFTPQFPPAVSSFSTDYNCYWDEDAGQQICLNHATDFSSFSAGSYFYKIASFREGGELDLTRQAISPFIIKVNLPRDSSCSGTIYGPPASSNFNISSGRTFRWEYQSSFTTFSGWYLYGPNGFRFNIPVNKVLTTSNCRGISSLTCASWTSPYPLPSGSYYIQSYKAACGGSLGGSSNTAYLSSTQTVYSPPTTTATTGSGSAGWSNAYISASWQANLPARTCNSADDDGNCTSYSNDYNPAGYHLYRSSTPFDPGAAEVLNSGANFSSYDRYAYFPNLSNGTHYFAIKATNSCGNGWSEILKVDLPSGTVSGIQTSIWSALKAFIQKFLPF